MINKLKSLLPKNLQEGRIGNLIKIVVLIVFKIIDGISQIRYKKPKIESIEQLILTIILEKKSISRYGDGEMHLIKGEDLRFQKYDKKLASRLEQILKSESNSCLICIPDMFGSLKQYVAKTQWTWTRHMVEYRQAWDRCLDKNKAYYNSFVSRPYICYKDKGTCERSFKQIKLLWDKRKLLIVEGKGSRLGVGNDLFNNASEIRRIICPNKNAFSSYDDILETIIGMENIDLILIALGPTATVLAYDLSNLGYQALDIGHIDIEYEWFRRGVDKKVVIDGKFTNEATGGAVIESIFNQEYENQVIKTIG